MRREYVEGRGQVVALAAESHVIFLHRLKQRRLGARRGAVDLVGHQQLGEDRALDEPEGAFAVLGLFEHFGAENIRRHQVRRKLDTASRDTENGAERVDQLGLGESGNADEKRMAAGQDGDDGVLDHLFLAEDDLADFVAHGFDAVERCFGFRNDLGFAEGFAGTVGAHGRLQYVCRF